MDYDPRDFLYEEFEAQYADEMDAMEGMNPHEEEEETDPWSNYKVSDEMIQQALQEDAEKLSLQDKENIKPNHNSDDTVISPTKKHLDPLEKQLQSVRESLSTGGGQQQSSPQPASQEDSYPVIEFSFMSNNEQSPAPPVRISNAFKRRTAAAEEFGVIPLQTVGSDVSLMEDVEEINSASKRAKTDPEREKVIFVDQALVHFIFI